MYLILACVSVPARACVWVPERVGVCMRVRAYSLANQTRIGPEYLGTD